MTASHPHPILLVALAALLSGCAVDPGFMPMSQSRANRPESTAVVVTPVVSTTVAPVPKEVSCREEAYRRSFDEPAARDLFYGQAYRDCMSR